MSLQTSDIVNWLTKRTLAGAVIGCILGLIWITTPLFQWFPGGFLQYIAPSPTIPEILSPEPLYTPFQTYLSIFILFSPVIFGCILGFIIGHWLDIKLDKDLGKIAAVAFIVLGIIGIASVPYLVGIAQKYDPPGPVMGVVLLDTQPEDYYELSEEDLLKYPFFEEAMKNPGCLVDTPEDVDYLSFVSVKGKPFPWVVKFGDDYYSVHQMRRSGEGGISPITVPLIVLFSSILIIMSAIWLVMGRKKQ